MAADAVLLARDVFPEWRGLIRKARARITVFTPYMDNLLPGQLLAGSGLPADAIEVVTVLDAETLLQCPVQLRAIKRLIRRGHRVLQLDGLHAKVLLVDDAAVVLGSQNFTQRGRRNREASAASQNPKASPGFLAALRRWRRMAKPVDEGYVDALLALLKAPAKQYEALLTKTRELVEEATAHHARSPIDDLAAKLPKLEKQSDVRLEQGEAYATVKWCPSPHEWYQTLAAEPGHNLTRWQRASGGDTWESFELDRLFMYPLINVDTMRMHFARVGKTRITYLREGVEWSDRSIEVGVVSFSVNIVFPKTNTRRRNVVALLTSQDGISCTCAFLFTGDSFRVVSVKVRFPKEMAIASRKIYRELLNEEVRRTSDFFRRFLESFKYGELERYHHDLKDHLKASSYRLSVIQHGGVSVLALKSNSGW